MRVLITAGASGIGRAMGEAFDTAGYEVWVTDVDRDALAKLPDGWHGHLCDASDEGDVAAVFQAIAGAGGLDVLCANAGVAGPTALIEDIALEDWRTCVSVNLEGAFLAAKYAAPIMKEQNAGSIILTSSTAGIYGYPNRAPYASAKWAVIGLMKTLAMELGPYNIRANAIAPGCVDGPRIDGVIAREADAKNTTPEAIRAGYEAGVSMRSFVSADDIANMALFLAGNGARLVSGQVIAVDGGFQAVGIGLPALR